jgi:hypothetical protein
LSLNASFAESRLSVDYRQDYSAPGTIATNAGARAKLPFSIGVFSFEPFLDRRFKVSEAEMPAGFAEDLDLMVSRAVSIHKPFIALPLLDLFTAGLEPGFNEGSSGSDSASYSTGVGFLARRPIGYGLRDLFVPNTMEFLWTRTLESRFDTQLEYHDLRLKATTAAANLFASGGARPRFDELAYDEYSSDSDISARYHTADGAWLPALGLKHAVSTESLSGATMTAASRFSWKQTRTGSQASESLSLSLGRRPDRTWLGDLVRLIFENEPEDTKPEPEAEQENRLVQWRASIQVDSAVLRTSFDTALTLSGQDLSGSKALDTSFGYTTRVIVPGSLSVGFHAALRPGVAFRTDGWVWGLGYEFTLDGRVSF